MPSPFSSLLSSPNSSFLLLPSSFSHALSSKVMASSGFRVPVALFVCLVFLFHLPPTFASDFLSISPWISPIFDDVCKSVPCGKGNCSITKNSTVPFECLCEPGWKQPTSVNGFNFLPCLIPNCTMDISCSKATSPASTPNITSNGSIFNPCSWNICGGGTCKRSSSNTSYSCSCNTGFKNLMNSTSFPCYPECALEGDCPKLGIPLFNQSNSPAPAHSVDDSTNLGRSLQREKLSWVIQVLVMIFGPVIIWA